MRFFISAGEASGDTYGAQLIESLERHVPGAEYFGLGGPAMRAAGFDAVVDASDISVVGLAEVIGHLPRIYREFHRLLRAIDQRRPDAAILIDFPDFNFRLARQLHRRGIPVFYYISPQLWAWRSRRVELVRRYVRKMLVIFPFEAEWYRQRGVDSIYVGHPLANLAPPAVSRTAFAQEYGLDPERQWIALLPGSRRKEVLMNLPCMLEAAAQTGKQFQFILPVAPTLDFSWIQRMVENGPVAVALTRDARPTLLHACAGIVASGTATVEAALLGTPFVMVYRVSPLTWRLGRPFVRVPFYGMVNLIAGREVVPELVQDKFTAARVAQELSAILPGRPLCSQALAGLAAVRQALLADCGELCATERAAGIIAEMVLPLPARAGTPARQS